jgi:hypothetical protein
MVSTFEAALAIVNDRVDVAYETAIFLEHARYGGIFVWTSAAPDVANRFDTLRGPE